MNIDYRAVPPKCIGGGAMCSMSDGDGQAPNDHPKFIVAVEELLDILTDLDEFDCPKRKLPNCPKCDEDELGVIHANLLLCYRCGWKIEGQRVSSQVFPLGIPGVSD